MFQRIKLTECSVIHNNPPVTKIVSREDIINGSTEETGLKDLSISVSVLQIRNSGISYHKCLGPYIIPAYYCTTRSNACNLLFLCSCKIFCLNQLPLTLLTKLFFYIPY